MQVSAVSANHFLSNKKIGSTLPSRKDSQKDVNRDPVFNSYNTTPKRCTSIEKLGLYDSINEWKDFCHKQILSGNFDVIA